MMAAWDEVVANFDGNETINFGPRLELGTALYQLETHATISPRGTVTGLPHVSACAAAEMVLVSGDRQLTVYSDNCRKYLVTLDFESGICGMSLTDDGRYLAVGEQSGILHVFDVANCRKLFSTRLEETAEESERTFVEFVLQCRPREKNHVLLVVTGSGRLHVFGMDLVGLCEAVVSKDEERMHLLQEKVDHQVIAASEFNCESVTYAAVLPFSGDVITVGSGVTSVVCLWRQENARFVAVCASVYPSEESLAKCAVTQCEQFLLTLNSRHHMSLWSVESFTIVWHCNTVTFKDFAVLSNESKSNTLSVLALTIDSDGHSQATIYTIPDMECSYSVRLKSFVTLARCTPTLDGFYLVEGDGGGKEGSVARLRVRCLTESLPESRLQRMLAKKCFDEAVEFAAQYDLDVQLVYQAKAGYLVDLVSQGSLEEAAANVLALKECCRLMTEDEFVVDCCVSAAPSSLEMTHDLLEHVRTRLRKQKTNGPEAGRLMKKVAEAAHRLGTFQMVFTDAGSYSGFKWQEFRTVGLLQELTGYLENGRMHAVSTIWNRHRSDFELRLTGNFVERLLRGIPDEIPSEKLRDWLSKGLIPFAVESLPEALPAIAAWIGERARNMEIMERSGWPSNALEFCDLLVATFKMMSTSWNEDGLFTPNTYATQACNIWVALSKKSTDNAFLQLQTLASELSALCELHVQYNCRLALADFQQESVESITYRMLDRVVAAELIPGAICKTLRPYMKQHGLDEDKMLFQYVGDLSKRFGKMFSCTGDAPWESKAIAVIRCIKDPEFRSQALLTAMTSAYVPWNVDMETIVAETLATPDCPRAKEIEEKRRMVDLEKLLVTYGLRGVNLADRFRAENLSFYILTHDQPEAVRDALHVASFYSHVDEMHVYVFRAKFLVERGRLDDIRELFRGLDAPVAMELGERFVSACHLVLSSFFPKSEKVAYARACCDVVHFLLKLSNAEKRDWYEEILCAMESICSLQQEFGEYPSVDEFSSEEYRTACLKKYVEKVLGVKDGNGCECVEEIHAWNPERRHGKLNRSPYSSLFRLAQLLTIPREEVCLEIAKAAVDGDDIATAIGICKEIRDTVPEFRAGPVLMMLARKLGAVALDAERGRRIPNLASEVHGLACVASSSVPSDRLLESLELSRSTRFAAAVSDQCESGAYQSAVKGVGTSANASTFPEVDDIYVEDGLVLDSARVLPLVAAIDFRGLMHLRMSCSDYLQNRDRTPPSVLSEMLSAVFSATWSVIDHLRDNTQVELALGFALESVALTTEFLASLPEGTSDAESPLASMLLRNVGKLINVVQEMVVATLQRVFLCRYPDLSMAIACLCSLPKHVSFDSLKNLTKTAGFQYKRAGYVAQVALALTQLVKEWRAQKACQAAVDSARWGYQLAKLSISFREAFRGGKEEKFRLLPSLVQSSLVSISDLFDYCVTFELDHDRALLSCLRHLMVGAEKDADGERVACTMPVEEAIGRARILSRSVEATEDLVKTLESVLAQLDPCDYDRIEFVLRELETARPTPEMARNLKLLTFLKQYRSKTTANGKIPYHPLVMGAHWSVITPELTAETVDDWLPIATLLGLRLDDVLVTAVRNIVETYVTEGKSLSGDPPPSSWKEDAINWRLYYVTGELLTKIVSCELAVASAVWIVKILPVGAEKLLALKSCVLMAKRWQEASLERSADHVKAKKTSTEHSAMYRRLATEQILHNRHLGDPDLFTLSGSPAKLIFKLYEHPCITVGKDASKLRSVVPNVHTVVEEIAAANRVDAKKVRTALINQWLPSSLKRMQESADVTMVAGAGQEDVLGTTDDVDEDEANLLRVIYVLQCKPPEEAGLYLINVAYGADAAMTYMCRVRALQCLLALADVELVERLLPGKTVAQIREEVKVFLYLAKLERIGMPQTRESFERLSKEGLARTVWRNHNHDSSAVALVSDICLDYSVGDEQLWSCIVQQFVGYRCIPRLCNLLDRLSAVPFVWRLPFMETALGNLVSSVLGDAAAPLSGERLSDLLRLCSLVTRRPTAWTAVAVKKWIKELQRLELHACSLGWALLLPAGDEKRKLLNDILDPGLVSMVSQQLAAWTKAGYAIPLADLVSEYILGGLNTEPQNMTTVLSDKSQLRSPFLDTETTVFE